MSKSDYIDTITNSALMVALQRGREVTADEIEESAEVVGADFTHEDVQRIVSDVNDKYNQAKS